MCASFSTEQRGHTHTHTRNGIQWLAAAAQQLFQAEIQTLKLITCRRNNSSCVSSHCPPIGSWTLQTASVTEPGRGVLSRPALRTLGRLCLQDRLYGATITQSPEDRFYRVDHDRQCLEYRLYGAREVNRVGRGAGQPFLRQPFQGLHQRREIRPVQGKSVSYQVRYGIRHRCQVAENSIK